VEGNEYTEVWAMYNIKVDIQGIIWRILDLAQTEGGIVLIYSLMNIWLLKIVSNFLTNWETVSFSS